MPTLNREAILQAQDLPTKAVFVPEWNGEVIVKTLMGNERDKFEQWVENRKKDGKINIEGLKVRLVILCAVDENGNNLFTDEDADALNKKSSAAIDRLFRVAQDLNHFADDDVKELAKN